MKKLIIILILALIFISCQKEVKPNVAIITIETDIDSLETLKLFRPVSGILMWDNRVDSLSIIDDNKFSIDKPEYVRLLLNKKRYGMFLLSNQNYKITLRDSVILFHGDNASGQQLYNTFDRTPTGAFSFINNFDNDSTVVLLKNHVDNIKNKEISQIDSLLLKKEIDTQFHELLKTDIDYYYANAIISLADYKNEEQSSENNQDFLNLIRETSEIYPYNTNNKPQNWGDYIMELEIYPEIQNKYSSEQRNDFYYKDSLHPIYASIITKQIKEPFREQLLANYILNSSKQNNHEKSLITVFDEFKDNYPNSNYSKYLENDILIIRDYHEKIKKNLPESVIFIEDENINSLTDLIKEFKGKKLYIDVWATWCGPCKEEFSNNHLIADILEKNGYEKLFISLDEAKQKDKWIELIKYYDLSGYHHLASREFFKDFAENHSTYINSVAIPQYLIVNEKGEIMTNDAPRPGVPEDVLKIIKS